MDNMDNWTIAIGLDNWILDNRCGMYGRYGYGTTHTYH